MVALVMDLLAHQNKVGIPPITVKILLIPWCHQESYQTRLCFSLWPHYIPRSSILNCFLITWWFSFTILHLFFSFFLFLTMMFWFTFSIFSYYITTFFYWWWFVPCPYLSMLLKHFPMLSFLFIGFSLFFFYSFWIAGMQGSLRPAMEQVSEECHSSKAPVDLAVWTVLFPMPNPEHSLRSF